MSAPKSVLSRRDIPCLPSSVITTTQGKAQGGEEEDLTRRRAGPANISEPSRGAANTISRFTSAQGEKGEESRATEALSGEGHPPLGARREPRKAPRTPSSAHFGPLRIPHPNPAAACGFYAARAAQKAAARDYRLNARDATKCRSRSPEAHAHSCERDRDTNKPPGASNQRRDARRARHGSDTQQFTAS